MLYNGRKVKPAAMLCGVSLLLASLPLAAQPLSSHASAVHVTKTVESGQSFRQVADSLPAGVTLNYSAELAALYRYGRLHEMWQDPSAVSHFEQQLAEVALSGVQPRFGQWLNTLSRRDLTAQQKDLLLSDAMLGYLQFVAEVPQKGETWLYSDTPYPLALPPQAMINRWQSSLSRHQLDAFIASLVPNHPLYRPMQVALKKLLADHQHWPQLTGRGSLRPGDVSPDVPVLRDILVRYGMLSASATPPPRQTTSSAPITAVTSQGGAVSQGGQPVPSGSGGMLHPQTTNTAPATADSSGMPLADSTVNPANVYSADLVEAVKRFQHWQGLASDGVIGPRTRDWLNVTPRMRAGLLALNMQRLRLLPDDMHNGIMVNIPDFSLNYYEQGQTILSSRVIVGRPDRKTPLMRSALNSVVLNPPWNPPTSLVKEDIVPKAKKDPNWLQQHGFTLLSDWSANAQVINPQSIDWATVNPASFPYRVRQAPGPQSALGRYKFNMPSSDAIYLHDTPNHMLFERDIRAMSSGCVRINKAAQLADILLQEVGWDNSRVASVIQQGDTRYIPIRHRVPVNLYYLSAWVSSDGDAQYRTDIYNYDNQVSRGQSSAAEAEKILL